MSNIEDELKETPKKVQFIVTAPRSLKVNQNMLRKFNAIDDHVLKKTEDVSVDYTNSAKDIRESDLHLPNEHNREKDSDSYKVYNKKRHFRVDDKQDKRFYPKDQKGELNTVEHRDKHHYKDDDHHKDNHHKDKHEHELNGSDHRHKHDYKDKYTDRSARQLDRYKPRDYRDDKKREYTDYRRTHKNDDKGHRGYKRKFSPNHDDRVQSPKKHYTERNDERDKKRMREIKDKFLNKEIWKNGDIWKYIFVLCCDDDFEVLLYVNKEFHRIFLKHAFHLKIKHNVQPTTIISLISKFEHPANINLSSNNKVTDNIIEAITKNNKDISQLSISSPHITDRALHYVSQLNLRKLSLRFCLSITDQGLFSLTNLTNLLELDMGHCNKLSQNGLQQNLKNFTNLQSLSLDMCNVNNNVLQSIEMLTKLRKLNCRGAFTTDEAGISVLTKLHNLEELNLALAPVENKVLIRMFFRLPKLKLLTTNKTS